jgi:hypothetical protein
VAAQHCELSPVREQLRHLAPIEPRLAALDAFQRFVRLAFKLLFVVRLELAKLRIVLHIPFHFCTLWKMFSVWRYCHNGI